MYETIIVFWGFSPLTVWNALSPVTPTTEVVWGTSPMPHLSTFHILLGAHSSPQSSSHWVYWSKNLPIWTGFCCYRSANWQVNWSFLPYLRVPLVKALQPAPSCLSLYWAKAFVVVSGCHFIGQYTHLLSSEREASSGIYHNNFFEGSFLV